MRRRNPSAGEDAAVATDDAAEGGSPRTRKARAGLGQRYHSRDPILVSHGRLTLFCVLITRGL